MSKLIYADNAATTPLSAVALEAMLPYMTEAYGNASATHSLGVEAKKALEEARKSIAQSLGAFVNEIYFTSGGTESDNWALCGVVDALEQKRGGGESREGRGNLASELSKDGEGSRANEEGCGGEGGCASEKSRGHIITTAIEHSAVFQTAQHLETLGYEVSYLVPNKEGLISPEQLVKEMREDTFLISIMLANNEIGTILPIKELCKAAKAQHRKVIFHTDAVQAAGHIPLSVRDLGIDILSLSAHKFGGPKGVGAQFIKLGTSISPYLRGGGQEKGRRSGTDNVPGVIGMAAALKEAVGAMSNNITQISSLRDRLIEGILRIPGAQLTGCPVSGSSQATADRLPGTASFVFEDFGRKPLVTRLDEFGICVSSGSSCSSSSEDPSRVLLACGHPEELALAPLRVTLSERNTIDDVDYIVEKVGIVVSLLRAEKAVPVSLDI